MSTTDLLTNLRPQVSGDLRSDLYTRTLYSTDASLYQVMPTAVLIPKHVDDIQAAVTIAAQFKAPLLPRAGGSSLAGQAVNTALVIDTSRYLDQLLELNVEERWVRVQPGIVLDTLNEALRAHGFQFGPDPASSNRACLGGIVSNNSTGSHSILYGMTADHVIGLEVILSDGRRVQVGPLTPEQLAWRTQAPGREGEVYRTLTGMIGLPIDLATIRQGTPRHWRRCGGYNLARFVHDGTIDHFLPQDTRFNLANLLCGAEGTLGVITELKLRVVPRPKRTALVVIEFPTLLSSLEAVPAILEAAPSAVELIDDLSLSMARQHPAYNRLLRTFASGEPFCLLAIEFYGDNEAELRAKCEKLMADLPRHGLRTGPMSALIDPARQTAVWNLRKAGLGLLMSVRSEWKPIPFIEDTAVPPEHLATYIPKIEAFCAGLGTRMTYYAHASAGCLHIRPLLNIKLAPEVEKMKEIGTFVAELLGDYGGALSSEHGDGRARSWLNERFYGPELYALFKRVKWAFDPDNLFNPGNIVDAPPVDQDLRYPPGYHTDPIATRLHFAEGIAHEIEMCNGAAVCRKLNSGAMCPSFMATREEEHATRGRANLLRAALSGTIPAAELTSSRMYAALELCVACKACKNECPSAVDMAKLKTEFLAQYYDKHERPLRDTLFIHFDALSRLGSGWRAPIANWLMSRTVVHDVLERTLGIKAERSLPRFARRPFSLGTQRATALNTDEPTLAPASPPATPSQKRIAWQPTVVLFADTYNTYSSPHVIEAACAVLTAAGYRVVAPKVTDAGRPALSKGLVDLARSRAQAVVDALEPHVRMGRAVVFLEPSDWSAIVDDYGSLLPDDSRVSEVARYSYTFEQFMVRAIARGEWVAQFRAEPGALLLHTHCHQKALGAAADSQKALELAGYRVSTIDTACCGMAGAFGYEQEHYAVSLQMAELRLLPAVRAMQAQALIVAPGVSCRQQIAHGAQRAALHPAEAVHMALL
ncbi:MAG: FAD-binding protein [Anaerolineales bacterium]|nr:FAD-binding protein [Anaerolineales bacterium]